MAAGRGSRRPRRPTSGPGDPTRAGTHPGEACQDGHPCVRLLSRRRSGHGGRPRDGAALRTQCSTVRRRASVSFGLFAAPDRSVVFDVNDFDETNPGPFEWDVKRLATSFVLAARDNALPDELGVKAALAVAASYRESMASSQASAKSRPGTPVSTSGAFSRRSTSSPRMATDRLPRRRRRRTGGRPERQPTRPAPHRRCDGAGHGRDGRRQGAHARCLCPGDLTGTVGTTMTCTVTTDANTSEVLLTVTTVDGGTVNSESRTCGAEGPAQVSRGKRWHPRRAVRLESKRLTALTVIAGIVAAAPCVAPRWRTDRPEPQSL